MPYIPATELDKYPTATCLCAQRCSWQHCLSSPKPETIIEVPAMLDQNGIDEMAHGTAMTWINHTYTRHEFYKQC